MIKPLVWFLCSKEDAPVAEEIKMDEKEPEDKDRATEETPMIQQEVDGWVPILNLIFHHM